MTRPAIPRGARGRKRRPIAAKGPKLRRGDSPHITIIAQEAWRNLTSGTTRALILAVVFAAACGGMAVAQTRVVADFIADAIAFRNAGSAIQVVSLAGGINPQQCDDLADAPGVVASGAVRTGPDIRLASLPSTTIASVEVSPGFIDLLVPTSVGTSNHGSGVWVAANLAERAGIGASGAAIPLADRTDLTIAGIYSYPNDGRAPTLDYAIVSPVTTSTAFDACWVYTWPNPEDVTDVLTLAVTPRPSGPADQPPTVMTTQLNTTLGLTFDAERRFATLPLWPVRVAGVVIAFGLGFLSIRLRRLELAGTLHAGVAKSALGLEISIETASWALVGGLVGAVGCLWASMISNPDWPASISPGIRTLALCVLATLLGALLGLAMTRESQLFRYFRVR